MAKRALKVLVSRTVQAYQRHCKPGFELGYPSESGRVPRNFRGLQSLTESVPRETPAPVDGSAIRDVQLSSTSQPAVSTGRQLSAFSIHSLLGGQYRKLTSTTSSRRKYLIDTLALVRKLEAQGLTAEQAEGLTGMVSHIMNVSMEEVTEQFVTKLEMQMTEVMAESALSKFKRDILITQEQQYDALRKEADRLKTELEKTRSELKYEVEKMTAGQRLDMNLEKGKIREELQNQHQETGSLTNKLDKEINNLKTELEATKFDVIKYCVGTLVSISVVGLGILRIMM